MRVDPCAQLIGAQCGERRGGVHGVDGDDGSARIERNAKFGLKCCQCRERVVVTPETNQRVGAQQREHPHPRRIGRLHGNGGVERVERGLHVSKRHCRDGRLFLQFTARRQQRRDHAATRQRVLADEPTKPTQRVYEIAFAHRAQSGKRGNERVGLIDLADAVDRLRDQLRVFRAQMHEQRHLQRLDARRKRARGRITQRQRERGVVLLKRLGDTGKLWPQRRRRNPRVTDPLEWMTEGLDMRKSIGSGRLAARSIARGERAQHQRSGRSLTDDRLDLRGQRREASCGHRFGSAGNQPEHREKQREKRYRCEAHVQLM